MEPTGLKKELETQVEQIMLDLQELRSTDPLKIWFSLELETITNSNNAHDDTLPELNARLHALKQLQYLLFEHKMQLRNPALKHANIDHDPSLLTLEASIPSNVLDSARNFRFSIAPSLLHDPTKDNESFDPVSPTAKIVGYLRGMDTSLNLMDQVCFRDEGEQLLHESGITNPETQSLMAVLFQSRYHAVNAAIGASDSPQIIEFAAGVSPRGFQWSEMTPNSLYVESDLPQLMIHKSKLIRNHLMKQPGKPRGCLHCCAVDVLDEQSVLQCVRSINPDQPFTVVTEGLLLYFNQHEMEQFLKIIRQLLTRYPKAAWVTDLVTKMNLQELCRSNEEVARGVKSIFSKTDRQVIPDNPFEDREHAIAILKKHNLEVEQEIPLSKTSTSLLLNSSIPQMQRDSIVGSRSVFRLIASPT